MGVPISGQGGTLSLDRRVPPGQYVSCGFPEGDFIDLTDNHCKTIYEPIRIDRSPYRVVMKKHFRKTKWVTYLINTINTNPGYFCNVLTLHHSNQYLINYWRKRWFFSLRVYPHQTKAKVMPLLLSLTLGVGPLVWIHTTLPIAFSFTFALIGPEAIEKATWSLSLALSLSLDVGWP